VVMAFITLNVQSVVPYFSQITDSILGRFAARDWAQMFKSSVGQLFECVTEPSD